MWAPWFYLFIFYQQSLHPVSFCDENPLCVGSDSVKRWERMKMVWDNKKSNYQGLGKRYCTYIQEAFNLLRAPFQWAVVPVSTSLIYAKSNGEKQNDVSHPSNRSQKSEDTRKLPLGERQNHGDVSHSISSVGQWGRSIWNCDVPHCSNH